MEDLLEIVYNSSFELSYSCLVLCCGDVRPNFMPLEDFKLLRIQKFKRWMTTAGGACCSIH